jgi:CDP-diacylglycerol pyrophosphatase
MLAIPTARVTGIEDPQVLAPDAPDYFAAAWRARRHLDAHLGRPTRREDVAITINSEYSRSQDQLHLHVDCLLPQVAAALDAYRPAIDAEWRPMTVALSGRQYWARRVDSPDLVGVSPFRLLSEGPMGAKDRMGLWTLAAVPADFGGKPGFVLLADHAELTQGGHAEDIQDHACAIAPPKS